MLTPFHLAYHVTDLDDARAFYGGVLGCAEGRSTDTWVDFDFFGHQISLHRGTPFETTNTGARCDCARVRGLDLCQSSGSSPSSQPCSRLATRPVSGTRMR